MSRGTEFVSDSGRHHRDDAQAWTPRLPAQTRSGNRGAHESRPEMAPPGNTRGHLAGELPAIPTPRQQQGARRAETRDYPASRGELPLATPPGSEPEQAPRRTRISFSELEPAPRGNDKQPESAGPAGHTEVTETPDDAEPVPNGLGMFDLGSVPASVTPPSTWRRAAWFAAASSGGVMGLLFAGTFLLGQQPAQPQAAEHWSYLNRRGGSPLFDRDELLSRTNQVPAPGHTTVTGTHARQAPAQATTNSGPDSSSQSSSASSTAPRDGAGMRPEPTSRTGTQTSPTSESSSTQRTTSRPATPTTTSIPQKPPPTPPESERANPKRGLMSSRSNWREMAAVSNDYLNTVTENPQQALQYTTGELHAKGADGLRRKYARIAYFEVRKITVNEDKGFTVNTVKVVYKDSHTEIRKHTLTFSDNGKISHASP